ncbi:hypothetical protein [Pseudoalteromonas piscicida]|uniref:hypothetical protein n=1 Tax=Pseudoalteromonas piscicida TaxID=43662 RepID=UPI0005FA8187|nr:hypothetical protein [Pseudoalteromonas piscicida]KJZ05222.1 hypothetical protein TW73_01420 [Pseudoalteromonas piscicida]
MEQFFATLGGVAGIGGVAIGAFLILYNKIKLPSGTRKHLTLFMWLVWSICIVAVVGYFVVQKPESNKVESKIAKWEEGIPVTYPDQGEFIEFLKSNVGKKIYLSSYLGMSLSSEESYQIASLIGYMEDALDIIEPNGDLASDGIDLFQEDSSLSIPLDGIKTGAFLRLNLLNNRVLPVSYGGTGVVQFPVDGYFKVALLAYSGPRVVFELTELPVSMTINTD